MLIYYVKKALHIMARMFKTHTIWLFNFHNFLLNINISVLDKKNLRGLSTGRG